MRTSAFLFFALTAAAADPALLNFTMPDARFISGIQVDQSKKSPFGQYVLKQMQADDDELRKFILETGFDPARDLTEIVAATTGTAENPKTVIIGRGSFHPELFASAARAHGGSVSLYNGIELLAHTSPRGEGAIAFLDASTAVMGDIDAVRAAIDRKRSPTAVSPDIASRIRDLSSANDAWFLSTGPIADFLGGKVADENLGQAMQGNLLQAILQASGGVRFGADTVQISAEALTKSEKDASALGDVLRFLTSLVTLQKSKSDQAAKMASLADSLQITTKGSTLALSMAIPEKVMEQLFIAKPPAAAPRARAER